ncbi:hypothetical protein L9F63_022733, partial [Diploptera punctata]
FTTNAWTFCRRTFSSKTCLDCCECRIMYRIYFGKTYRKVSPTRRKASNPTIRECMSNMLTKLSIE